MSGRAGRRGIDDRGIVMLMVDEQMDSTVGKNLLRVCYVDITLCLMHNPNWLTVAQVVVRVISILRGVKEITVLREGYTNLTCRLVNSRGRRGRVVSRAMPPCCIECLGK